MSLDRRVPEQDQAQNEELTSRAKEKRYREEVKENERQNAEIDKQNALIEKTNAEAEAKYQKELADFNALQNQQKQSDILQKQFNEKIAALEAEKARALSEIPSTDSNGRRLDRAVLKDRQNRIGKEYGQKIAVIQIQAKSVVDNALFSEAYPGRVMTQSDRKSIAGRTAGTSVLNVIEKKETAFEAKRQYQKESARITGKSLQAQSGYTSQQAYLIKKGSTGLRGELKQNPVAARRAEAIKETPNIITGKQADTRPRMINVNTGQSIMGGQKASPSQTVRATETYRETPTGPVLVRNVIRITPEIKASKGVPQGANPRAYVAGLDRQNVGADGKPIKERTIELITTPGLTQTGKIRVSNLNEWDGQKSQKMRVSDYSIDKLIGAYGYDKTNEIITNRNKIIDSNNVIIKAENRKNRNEYFDFRRQQVREDKYFKSPKAQGPPKPKFETVIAAPTLNELVISNNQTPENIFIQNKYSELDKLSAKLNKEVTSDDERKLVQVGAEAGKGLLSIAASVQNFGEQTIRPFLTGKSPTNPPVVLSGETTSTKLFPIGEGWRIKSGDELLTTAKEEYKKYGPATFVGEVLPTFGIGTESLVRGGGMLFTKGVGVVGFVGQSQKLLLQGSEELQTVYRGVTFRNRPLVGVQQGRLQLGMNYDKIPYEKIDIKNPVYARSGMEAGLGSGIEKFTFYSRPALEAQKRKGVIDAMSAIRAEEVSKGLEMGMKAKSNVGSFGNLPFEGQTQKQSDYILKTAAQQQKKGNVDLVHGSVALGPQVPKEIQPMIKFGDIDIVPKKPTVENANKLVDLFAKNYPLEKGQTIKVIKPSSETANRQIFLISNGDNFVEAGMTVFHGTFNKNAKDILKRGFTFSKSQTSKDTIFAGTKQDSSYDFRGSTLKITLRKDVKVFDVNKQVNQLLSNDELRTMARNEKSDIIKNMMQGGMGTGSEIEILNSKAILKIESVPQLKGSVVKNRPGTSLLNKSAKSTTVGQVWKNPQNKVTGVKGEPKKILEVVLKGDETLKSGESIVTKGDRLFGFKIPFGKSVKETSTGLKVHTANYQLLTNTKQVLAYQKGDKVLLDIYPSSGRTKDIARVYLNLKGKAIFQGGKQGEKLDVQAEKIKGLYKIDFGDVQGEKIILSSSPQRNSFVTSKSISKVVPALLRPIPSSPKQNQQSTNQRLVSKQQPKQSVKSIKKIESIKPTRISSKGYSKISRLGSSRMSVINSSSSKTGSSKQSSDSKGSSKSSSDSSSNSKGSTKSQIKPISTLRSVNPPSPRTLYGLTPLTFKPSVTPTINPSKTPTPPTPKYPQLIPPPSKTPPTSRIPPSLTPSKYPPTTSPPYRQPPPTRKALGILGDHGSPKRETPKSKSGEKADFLGNTSETQVSGLFNRSETTYGLRKIAKLSRGDRRVERGGNRSVRRGTAKFVEGKGKDPFGFKDKSKKGKNFRISF